MVELVIVILVVGILALIALPKVTHHDRIVELAEQIANDIRYTQMLAMSNDVDYGSISSIAPKLDRESARANLLWTIVFFGIIQNEEDYRLNNLSDPRYLYIDGAWTFPFPEYIDGHPPIYSLYSAATDLRYGIMRHTFPYSAMDKHVHENRNSGSPEERIFARGSNGDLLGCWQKWNSWEAKHLKYDAKTRCNKRFHIRPEDKIKVTISKKGCIVPPGVPASGGGHVESVGISFDNMGRPQVPRGYGMGAYNETYYGHHTPHGSFYGFYIRKYIPNQGCDIILRSQKKKAVISVWGETGYVSVKYYDMP
jgi:hypothetical protein